MIRSSRRTSLVISIAALLVASPSLTSTVKAYAPGPCASSGVQVNAPLAGSIAAPAGIVPASAKVSG